MSHLRPHFSSGHLGGYSLAGGSAVRSMVPGLGDNESLKKQIQELKAQWVADSNTQNQLKSALPGLLAKQTELKKVVADLKAKGTAYSDRWYASRRAELSRVSNQITDSNEKLAVLGTRMNQTQKKINEYESLLVQDKPQPVVAPSSPSAPSDPSVFSFPTSSQPGPTQPKLSPDPVPAPSSPEPKTSSFWSGMTDLIPKLDFGLPKPSDKQLTAPNTPAIPSSQPQSLPAPTATQLTIKQAPIAAPPVQPETKSGPSKGLLIGGGIAALVLGALILK